jgi:hypothetical protein
MNTPQHGQRINFDNICEIIQASDEFSRHLETYYGLIRRVDLFSKIIFLKKNTEFMINPEESYL